MKKIQQVIFNSGTRLKYSQTLGLAKHLKLKGYIVIANSDIFFDETINNLITNNRCDK